MQAVKPVRTVRLWGIAATFDVGFRGSTRNDQPLGRQKFSRNAFDRWLQASENVPLLACHNLKKAASLGRKTTFLADKTGLVFNSVMSIRTKTDEAIYLAIKHHWFSHCSLGFRTQKSRPACDDSGMYEKILEAEIDELTFCHNPAIKGTSVRVSGVRDKRRTVPTDKLEQEVLGELLWGTGLHTKFRAMVAALPAAPCAYHTNRYADIPLLRNGTFMVISKVRGKLNVEVRK